MSSTVVSSPSSTKRKSPKSKQMLKLSCDACARLKVACPKEQPECGRCVSKGLHCVYSLACRTGKRKRSKTSDLTNHAQSPSASPQCWVWQTPSPFTLPESEDALFQRAAAIDIDSMSAELPELPPNNSSVLGSPIGLATGIAPTMNSLQDALWQAADQPMPSIEPYSPHSTHHAYQEASMCQFPYGYFPLYVPQTNCRWSQQPTSPLFGSISRDYCKAAASEPTPSLSSACSSYSSTADLEATLLNGMGLQQLSPQPQDNCFTRTYMLLHTLQQPSTSICAFQSTNVPSPSRETNYVHESIDRILLKTDKAVQEVKSVMQCSCHTTSSVRCALTLVLFEVMTWYETIAHEINELQTEASTQASSPSCNSNNDEGYSTGQNSYCSGSKSSASSASPIITERVSNTPSIAIGEMQLPHKDVKSVLNYFVLSRIRTVRGIVESLSTDCDNSIERVARLDSMIDQFVKLQRPQSVSY